MIVRDQLAIENEFQAACLRSVEKHVGAGSLIDGVNGPVRDVVR